MRPIVTSTKLGVFDTKLTESSNVNDRSRASEHHIRDTLVTRGTLSAGFVAIRADMLLQEVPKPVPRCQHRAS